MSAFGVKRTSPASQDAAYDPKRHPSFPFNVRLFTLRLLAFGAIVRSHLISKNDAATATPVSDGTGSRSCVVNNAREGSDDDRQEKTLARVDGIFRRRDCDKHTRNSAAALTETEHPLHHGR